LCYLVRSVGDHLLSVKREGTTSRVTWTSFRKKNQEKILAAKNGGEVPVGSTDKPGEQNSWLVLTKGGPEESGRPSERSDAIRNEKLPLRKGRLRGDWETARANKELAASKQQLWVPLIPTQKNFPGARTAQKRDTRPPETPAWSRRGENWDPGRKAKWPPLISIQQIRRCIKRPQAQKVNPYQIDQKTTGREKKLAAISKTNLVFRGYPPCSGRRGKAI